MNLSQPDWTEKIKHNLNAVILDVRTQDEWDSGIIANAITIDIYKGKLFIDRITELDKSKEYFVYCKVGGRSAQACNVMNQLGFKNTYNLVGGIMDWEGDLIQV